MEIQFELEDETSFMKFVWDAEAKSSVFGLEPHNCFGVTLRDHHGKCLGYICQICDLPLINTVDGTNPAITSWVWHFIPVFTTGFIYSRWLFRLSPSTINQTERCKKKDISPSFLRKKRRAVCTQVGPKHLNCWVLLEVISLSCPSQKSHTSKGIPKCAECDWNINLNE